MQIAPCLFALTVASATATGGPTFVPKATILELRGGAGPIDPDVIGKTTAVLCLAQGAMATLGPKQTNEQYGISDEMNDDIQQFHMKSLGTGILSIGIIAYYLFFKDADIYKAAKVSNVLWAYETMRNILSGDILSGGYASTDGFKLCFAICVFTAYAMTQDYASTVLKATSIFWGLVGLQCRFAPQAAKKLWKLDDDSKRTDTNTKEFSVCLLSTALLEGSLVFFDDMTKTKALGLSGLPWLLTTLISFFDGTYDFYGVNKNMMAPWLVYHIVAAVSLLL